MCKKIANSLYIFLFFLLPTTTYAQDLKFWHLTVNDGLSNSGVNCFLQDSRGFMWIATQDGLNRYDGYNIEIYRKEAKDQYSFTNNYINNLYEDKDKNIWVATSGGGLYRYDSRYNRFIRINEISINVTQIIFEDSQNTLWVSAANMLYFRDAKTNKFTAYPKFTETVISGCIEIAKNKFLVATEGSGLYILDISKGAVRQFIHEEKDANSLCNNTIKAIYKDINNDVWIGTEQGLDRLNISKMSFEHFLLNEDKSKSLLINVLRKINGKGYEVWFGTENGGLSKLDLRTMRFTHYTNDKANLNSISDNSIWSIYFDKQNRLWVGTFSGGANIADAYREKFSKPAVELKNQTVNTILKDSKNRLWIGTELGLAVKDGEKIDYYYHDPKQKNSLPNNPVLEIYEDHENRIWVGTWAGGLSRFDEEKKRFINITADASNPKKLYNPNIFGIVQSSETKQLFLASFGGLLVMESETPLAFTSYSSEFKLPENVVSNYITNIFEDSKKRIWIGTVNGLNRYDIHTKKIALYAHDEEDSSSLSANVVNCVMEDNKGRIWVGTTEGLSMMVREGVFASYTKKNGLPNNTINGILEDKKGNLWLSTNDGLSCFNLDKQTFRNYTESDGLQSRQFKPDARFVSKEGELFFGGVNGFNAFYPDSIKDNPHLPSVLITDFKMFNKSVKVGDYDSLLRSVINQTQEITLNHTLSVFSIEYVGINFTHSPKNQYAYRLVPFEKQWNYVGDKREATYTNLDAGIYTFQVKASNNDGVWNEEGKTLKITILPPWWKTWWFRGGIFLLVVISVIAYNRIKMATLRKRNLLLEQKVTERTKDLKLASEQIKTQNEELQASEEELRQNMEELEANQELLKEQKQIIEVAFENLNKQNQKINDSIRYAQHIQNAVLPHQDILAAAFAEHFVIFKPKDVVSGDFYWYLEVENKKFLAIVDCTGHGVPGAFMSMIGNTLLYEIINAKRIFEPHHILEELHIGILNSLNKKDAKIQDGMDMVICCIERMENGDVSVQYSGAKRPLYYFSKQKLSEVQADKKSIGQSKSSQINYTANEIILQSGDTLYMSTDGWIDSINPERKRFGSPQFKEMLLQGANLSLKAQEEVFRHILEDYEQGTEQRDDVLLVGVRV